MERILKELIQTEKKRNSLLADISESLKIIASKESSTQELFSQINIDAKQHQKNNDKSAFGI